MSFNIPYSNFSDLEGKNVLIVGGFGLIGRALCEAFASVKSNLFVGSRERDGDFLKKLENLTRVKYLKFDITKERDIDEAINVLVKEGSVDVFC